MATELSNNGSVVGSSTCPFRKRNYLKRLGNHLPYCNQRNGRDYAPFLSNKSLAKKGSAGSCKTKFCPKCHKHFSRLDTHLRKSATCRDISQHDHSPVPAVPALVSLPLNRVVCVMSESEASMSKSSSQGFASQHRLKVGRRPMSTLNRLWCRG